MSEACYYSEIENFQMLKNLLVLDIPIIKKWTLSGDSP